MLEGFQFSIELIQRAGGGGALARLMQDGRNVKIGKALRPELADIVARLHRCHANLRGCRNGTWKCRFIFAESPIKRLRRVGILQLMVDQKAEIAFHLLTEIIGHDHAGKGPCAETRLHTHTESGHKVQTKRKTISV